MQPKICRFLMVGVLFCHSGARSFASEVIEVPEEELSKESVLPVFDFPDTVRNRNVSSANRFEFGLLYGLNFTEPIYNQTNYDFNFGYNWNEYSSIIVHYMSWAAGRNNQYTDSLYDQYKLDFSRAPDKQSSIFVNYERKSYYGKISLTKQTVMNLHFYPIFGIGTTKYVHKSYMAANAGVGWKFYFNNRLALRTDLLLLAAEGPSPFLANRMKTTNLPPPSATDFSDKWSLGFNFDLGLSFMF